MMWCDYSPVGTFIIGHDSQRGYGLLLDTDPLCNYTLPEIATGARSLDYSPRAMRYRLGGCRAYHEPTAKSSDWFIFPTIFDK